MRFGRVTVTGGFVLVWGFTVYLGAGAELALCVLTALLHEAGHFLAVWLWGGGLESVELNASGATIRARAERLTYGREILCVLAGPAASLTAALLFALWSDTIPFGLTASGLCLMQGLFNLLPARGLDGGRALRLALESRRSVCTERVTRLASYVSVWIVSALTAVAFARGGYDWIVLGIGALAVTAMLGTGRD